ncbi:nucleotidyltransferase domain-containing protein [candidate division KSB1 bacterium]|nr:nucleotidyltransferase domain-containing protein [candidate division KSB1 bacterium]
MNYKFVQNLLKAFSQQLLNQNSGNIDSIIWYGSSARGDAQPDSDIDIAIIVDEENNETWRKINDLAAQYSLEYDCLISILLISNRRFLEMKQIGRLLARNLEKDGKILWSKAA